MILKPKENILENFQQSAIDAEKNNKILLNYLEKLERKKSEFEIFMKEKGKKAKKKKQI